MRQWERIKRLATKSRYQSGLRCLFLLLFLLVILTLNMHIGDFDSDYNQIINEDEIVSMANSWSMRAIEDKHFILSTQLPEVMQEDSTLAFESDHQTIIARVGDSIIYQRDPENPWFLGHEVGRVWNLIHIPNEFAGEILEVELDNYADMQIRTDTSMFSAGKNIMRYLFIDHLAMLVFAIVLVTLGFILLLLAFGLRQRAMRESAAGLMNLAFILIFLSVQMSMDSYIAQFIQFNLAVAYILAQTFYLALPILFMQYLRGKVYRGHLILDLLCLFQMVYLAIVVTLHFHGNVLLVHQRVMICVLLLIYGFATAALGIDTLQSSPERSEHLIPIGAVLFVDTIGIVLVLAYLFGNREFNLYLVVLAAELIFLCALFYDQLRKLISVFMMAAEARGLKKVAYEDTLTGLYNRRAYDRDIAELNMNLERFERVGALVLDMNNLKKTNDGHGHDQGDYLIASAGRLIAESFQPHGHAYRMGGDEFTVVMADESVLMIDQILDHFVLQIEQYNKTHSIPLNLSWGFASMEVTKNQPYDSLINQMLHMADERMYQSKRSQKNVRIVTITD